MDDKRMLYEMFGIELGAKLVRENKYSYLDIINAPNDFGTQYAGSKKSKHNNIKRKRRR
jgi:hypothetical protein